ncbi:MAG: hypothetical protein AB1810_01075 [Pseudomonadota bacterium]
MLLIVAITGAAGFLASYWLLQAGLTEMWVRYLCAFGVAYLVFLFLLWLWLRTSAEDYTDVPDLSGLPPSSGRSGDIAPGYGGKGGNFGGGGASGSYDGPMSTTNAFDNTATSTTLDSRGAVGDALGAAANAEEFAIPLVVLVLLGALLFSSFFVIYAAPGFFAELLLDGVLAATLYRRLRKLETRHWLETAVRRTAIPFLATALIVAISGWGMKLYAPEAHSIGDVIAHAKQIR